MGSEANGISSLIDLPFGPRILKSPEKNGIHFWMPNNLESVKNRELSKHH
jgi:hypothetical protein